MKRAKTAGEACFFTGPLSSNGALLKRYRSRVDSRNNEKPAENVGENATNLEMKNSFSGVLEAHAQCDII